MRISTIKVDGLFGRFNYTIDLNADERITIIHGPNGYGKTVLLRLIDSVFAQRFWHVRREPFDSLTVSCEDGQALRVTRTDRGQQLSLKGMTASQNKAVQLTLHRLSGGLEVDSFTVKRPKSSRYYYFAHEKYLKGLTRLRRDRWKHISTGVELDEDDLYEYTEPQMPAGEVDEERRIPSWVKDFCESVRVRFVSTERLVVRDKSTSEREDGVPMAAVTRCSSQITRIIRSTLQDYALKSQALDRTFPNRLLEEKDKRVLTVGELEQELEKLDYHRKRLVSTGLLSAEVDLPRSKKLDDQSRSVLTIFVSDYEQKLGVLDGMSDRIDILQSIVNSHFGFKKLTVDRERGLCFRTAEGLELPPERLSSGEQQLLVLMYELLFETEKDTLILIDEPELSLHVEWQQQFLNDVAKATKLASFDVLMATHSPQIIHGRWDLTVTLSN